MKVFNRIVFRYGEKINHCPSCEGTGWTKEGWEKYNKESGFDPPDPFKGDCQTCGGTGIEKQ